MKAAVEKWGRKPVVIGLSIHCAIWWALVLSITAINSDAPGWWFDVVDLVASPFAFAPALMTRAEFAGWAALRVLITFSVALSIYVAVKTRRRRAVLLAHFAVVVYWLASMLIFVAGIMVEVNSF